MTDYSHPITPPTELVTQWKAAASNVPASLSADLGERRDYIDYIATQAARWGADIELEACCEIADDAFQGCGLSAEMLQRGASLRAARRLKPPTLKERGRKALQNIHNAVVMETGGRELHVLQAIVESLPD